MRIKTLGGFCIHTRLLLAASTSHGMFFSKVGEMWVGKGLQWVGKGPQ